MPVKLIAVTRTSSKGSSLRMTLPKEIAEKLNVTGSEHIGFYDVNGEIVIRKPQPLFEHQESPVSQICLERTTICA